MASFSLVDTFSTGRENGGGIGLVVFSVVVDESHSGEHGETRYNSESMPGMSPMTYPNEPFPTCVQTLGLGTQATIVPCGIRKDLGVKEERGGGEE